MKFVAIAGTLLAAASCAFAQGDTASSQGGTKPTEHVLGTITTVDSPHQSITVKDDKSGIETVISLAGTKTLIKVPPGAKDLKSAARITADQLASGDRVDVRGNKAPDDTSKIAARSVVLMSGRDLEKAHAVQAAEWQSAKTGVATAVDTAAKRIDLSMRTPAGRKPVTVQTSDSTEFTRYSPQNPGIPQGSQLGQIQPGDQVRVIADTGPDGSTLMAKRVYSQALRILNGTILSLAPGGKEMAIRDLATKKTVSVILNDSSDIQKLPPELAAGMARRSMSTGQQPPAGAGAAGTRSAQPPTEGTASNNNAPQPGGPAGGGMRGPRNGDISRLLERLPKIGVSDLKTGDAVVVSGNVADSSSSENAQQIIATHVIAGVEPLLQSSPARQGGSGSSLGGDWGLSEMTVPQ